MNHEDISTQLAEMRVSISELTKAMTVLARIEERQITQSQANERIVIRLDMLEAITNKHAISMPLLEKASSMVYRGVLVPWVLLGSILLVGATILIKHLL